ncbi:MAG: hypothetical protein JWQ21_4069 [Herminiimonas sp.]|nr:hypothetical protein [Herminiimonas sp.]
MTRKYFEKLIEEFCALGEVEGASGIVQGGPVAVNGVVFSLIYNEAVQKDVMFVYCDFGAAAIGREAEVYRALLETNLLLYPVNGPMYTVSPETGRVVFVNRYWLEHLNPQGLGNILAHLSDKAKNWREDQFLEVPPPRRNQSSTAKMLRELPKAGGNLIGPCAKNGTTKTP